MEYRRHVFVCTQSRDGGKPACGDRGGREVLVATESSLLRRPESIGVGVTGTACLGPCFDGPNAVIYPEGRWIGGLTVDDAEQIADDVCGD